MYDFPVHDWWSWVNDSTRDQNGSPNFSSIVRQCKWPSLSRERVEIQKICFNGKVKSHFSFLLCDKGTGEKRKETARGMVRRGNEGTIHLLICPRALVFLNGFLRLLICVEKIPLFSHLIKYISNSFYESEKRKKTKMGVYVLFSIYTLSDLGNSSILIG